MAAFRFKQFCIEQDQTAMKVGTDSVILGAWAAAENPRRILDLGCGTGLLALMAAQRYPEAQVTGVELDPAAFRQAVGNVQNSPWAERICLFQQDIGEFAQKCGQKFDLILANPPYFATGCECKTAARQLARYAEDYSHWDWLRIAEACLASGGRICFVLPFEAGEQLKTSAKTTALWLAKQTDIVTKSGKAPQRMLLSFAAEPQTTEKTTLTVYDSNNQYDPQFIRLTQAFYLKF